MDITAEPVDWAEVQEGQKTQSPCAPKPKVGKDGKVQARLVVLSVKLNAKSTQHECTTFRLLLGQKSSLYPLPMQMLSNSLFSAKRIIHPK